MAYHKNKTIQDTKMTHDTLTQVAQTFETGGHQFRMDVHKVQKLKE